MRKMAKVQFLIQLTIFSIPVMWQALHLALEMLKQTNRTYGCSIAHGQAETQIFKPRSKTMPCELAWMKVWYWGVLKAISKKPGKYLQLQHQQHFIFNPKLPPLSLDEGL